MKLQFVSFDNLDAIKANLSSWTDNFKQNSSSWLTEELDNSLFLDTKYGDIPDFTLDMSSDKPFLTEAKNVRRVYDHSKFLSHPQWSDERLSARLC